MLVATIGLMALVGCAGGIQPGMSYPTDTFVVPIGYQEAYRRADAQHRACLPQYKITGNLYSDNQSGVIRVHVIFAEGILSKIDMRQLSPESTEVKITVSNEHQFTWRQIMAMRASIETGSAICSN